MPTGYSSHQVRDAGNVRSVITCRVPSANRYVPVEFDGVVDLEGAHRWMRTFRRIDRVEFIRAGSNWRCTVSAVGHRRQVRRTAPLGIGLGLAELGLPAVVFDPQDVR